MMPSIDVTFFATLTKNRYPTYSLYTLGTENCRQLEAELEECCIVPTKRVQIGPTIGAHVGPEVFGLFYVAAAK